jgi:hypothetical protein
MINYNSKKTKNMKKLFKTTALLFLLSLLTILASCDNDNDPTNNVCEDHYVSTPITDAFSVANGYDDLAENMDLETHVYVIRIHADGEICSVAYQNPSTYAGDYFIEILNNGSSTMYTGNHSFSQTELEYQNITPVSVASGDLITIQRTINNSNALNQNVGRILRKSDSTDVPFPFTQGNIEFLSSTFYGGGGPVPNYGLPYIPLGFKLN